MSELKSTPLKEEHIQRGGKMVDFAGWSMPVQFEGIRAEHKAVREAVGLFDVSHMGEIFVRGPKSLESLQWLTSNDVAKLEEGQAQYTLLPNDQGGVVDDLIVYCLKKGEEYLLCVNAANIEKDYAWIKKHNLGADLKNESDDWAQIAVQGPKAMELVGKLFGEEVKNLGSFRFSSVVFKDWRGWVARTGYTGEDGVEIFIPNAGAAPLWQELMAQGEAYGAKPIGLGARDSLRLEMKFSLYGHEIDDESNPYEAGLGWVVKPKAKDFLGKDKIMAAKEAGLKRKLVGFKMIDKGIPREGYPLFSFDNQEMGKVTSGTMSPSLNEAIGIGYVGREFGELGSEFYVEIRGRKAKAVVVKTPFVHS